MQMYYTVIDIPKLAKEKYDCEFADWLLKNHEPIDFVWNLAKNKVSFLWMVVVSQPLQCQLEFHLQT